MAVEGISGLYGSEYINNTAASSKVENSLGKDYSQSTDEELMEVCKEFETYFVEQLYKSMEKMIPKDDDKDSGMLGGTSTLDYFKDMLTQEYAKNTSETGSLGIAQTLYEQMKRNYNL